MVSRKREKKDTETGWTEIGLIFIPYMQKIMPITVHPSRAILQQPLRQVSLNSEAQYSELYDACKMTGGQNLPHKFKTTPTPTILITSTTPSSRPMGQHHRIWSPFDALVDQH